MNYNLTDAIKRSKDYSGLIEVLVNDLSHALFARVRALDRGGGIIFQIAPERQKNDGQALKVILPLPSFDQGEGVLEISRDGPLSEDEMEFAKTIASHLNLVILGIEHSRAKASDVKAAIGVLSYSELESVICVFNELKDIEGLIVASKVAEEHSLSRSAIVNGLRKLESAGLIEARSLGMKGTYIKILNEQLTIELGKFVRRR